MLKVLIIDDSRMFRRVLKKIVGEHFEVIAEAADGNEGFDKFQEAKPDLTLLDITMPNCDGRECLEKIIESQPESKVIMITGIDNEETALECLRLGAAGYINKNTINVSCPEARKKTLEDIQSLLGGCE